MVVSLLPVQVEAVTVPPLVARLWAMEVVALRASPLVEVLVLAKKEAAREEHADWDGQLVALEGPAAPVQVLVSATWV